MVQLLTRYYNKNGVNDGVIYNVVNDQFQTIYSTSSKRLANAKFNKLQKTERRKYN